MTNTNRITEAEVRAAYKKSGMVPLCRRFSVIEGRCRITCGCPQTALYCAEHGSHAAPDNQLLSREVGEWAKERYGDDYAMWFREGFDEPEIRFVPMNERQRDGLADGVALRFALGRDVLVYQGPTEPQNDWELPKPKLTPSEPIQMKLR